MRALEQPSLDGPGAMRFVEVAVPVAGPGEVLVKVGAAGVNFADVMQTRGTYDGGPKPPYLAGFEAAGTIVALGDNVTNVALGDHVIGTGAGAFAEYMLMPANAVVPVPTGWSDDEALGLVLNWATALASLRLGQLTAGDTVLIHAAAGGVGQAAVRIAKHYGATVIATASASKHDVVRRLGADHVIGAADLVAEVRRLTGGRGADIVLESVGGETFRHSVEVARRVTGKVVVIGAAAGESSISNWELNFKHPVHVIGQHLTTTIQHAPELFAQVLEELDELIDAGVYPPGRPTVYDLADGPKALAELEARATVGKLALRPSDD
ncbi:NADPH:quinone oxidoreductase family protein [Kribbella speibonae]|uniref:NADPH:quinone oxidoreductase family protein n=1 Tax=Kribbella speibonae TaxID=1572660 RepID=A0A4R0IXA7_9ACTN|nr:NADPH:quinone oxidoreductase family protein [Kribbella speibonae]TCC37560.1 NADPH:quinone oxidoreductase family protein [Kribbella speibonae]